MYDVLAGKENMETSYVMSKGKALEIFPMLKQDGLVGALVYYDGGRFSSDEPRFRAHRLHQDNITIRG